jgi:hypothetical protein
MRVYRKPPQPTHVPGTARGEELVLEKGREPGRSKNRKSYRTARDSTGINAAAQGPILYSMPNIPPA